MKNSVRNQLAGNKPRLHPSCPETLDLAQRVSGPAGRFRVARHHYTNDVQYLLGHIERLPRFKQRKTVALTMANIQVARWKILSA